MSETIHRGKFLEDKIKEKGYTKDEVAEGCGVKRNAIYQWIKLEDLDMRKLKKACKTKRFNNDQANGQRILRKTTTQRTAPSTKATQNQFIDDFFCSWTTTSFL